MTIFLGEPAYGSCAVTNLKNSPGQISISFLSRHCTVNNVGEFYNTEHLSYQQNFTVTCRNGSAPSVDVNCFVVTLPPIRAKATVQGKLKLYQN